MIVMTDVIVLQLFCRLAFCNSVYADELHGVLQSNRLGRIRRTRMAYELVRMLLFPFLQSCYDGSTHTDKSGLFLYCHDILDVYHVVYLRLRSSRQSIMETSGIGPERDSIYLQKK